LLIAVSADAALYSFLNSSTFSDCTLAVEYGMQIGNKIIYDCSALQLQSTNKTMNFDKKEQGQEL
jgi:hypothetical protein